MKSICLKLHYKMTVISFILYYSTVQYSTVQYYLQNYSIIPLIPLNLKTNFLKT